MNISRKIEHINIYKLRLWEEANVRKENVGQDLDDLAGNIKKNGLQYPLLVKKEREQYLIFSGQRRFLACAKAGLSDIPCFIYEDIDIDDARILSLSENLYRLAMDTEDKARACNALLRKYKSKKKIAAALGISVQTVRNYLGFDALPNDMKRLVGKKDITYHQARKIYTKFSGEGQALKVAQDLASIPKNDRKKRQSFFTAVSNAGPTDSIEDIHKKSDWIEDAVEYRLLVPAKKSQILENIAANTLVEKEDIALDFLTERIEMHERREWGM